MVQILRSIAEGLIPVQRPNSLNRHRVRERAFTRPRAAPLPYLDAVRRLVDLHQRAARCELDIVVLPAAAPASQTLEISVRVLITAPGTWRLSTADLEVAQHIIVVAGLVFRGVWTRGTTDVLTACAGPGTSAPPRTPTPTK